MFKSIDTQNKYLSSFVLKVLLVLVFGVLFTRLFELQIVKGEYFRSLADNNRTHTTTIIAPRGQILARGGEILAGNTQTMQPIEVGNNVLDSILVPTRIYPLASASAQIVGYLSQTDEQNVQKVDPHCPEKGVHRVGQLQGKSGIEEQYDCVLRGIDGLEMIEVDINGKKLRTVGRKPPIPGDDVQTTIDYGLQQRIAAALNGSIGAAVATDGHGQILGIASSPSFDPSIFIDAKKNSELVQKALTSKDLPLFNRAISGAYHPGSVFKLIVGAAALNDAAITAESVFKDSGVLSVNGFDYSSWYFTQYGRVEGEQTFAKALARSTDTFFYKVGETEGIDKLVYWADQFGVGKKSGVDIPGEVSGILPSPDWKQKVLGERWFLGNTYHFSIGQGDLLVTPLQVNVWTSAFANGGLYCTPYLSLTNKKESCVKLSIKPEVLEEVKRGMKMACETGGTAYPFFEFEPKVACKTGTAETGSKGKTHAWFTIMAPADDPEIVLSVLVENGGEGSAVAAPIAKNILDYWFHERAKP